MRLNQFIAKTTDLSRRNADKAIVDGRVLVNSVPAIIGQIINEKDVVYLDGKNLVMDVRPKTIKS